MDREKISFFLATNYLKKTTRFEKRNCTWKCFQWKSNRIKRKCFKIETQWKKPNNKLSTGNAMNCLEKPLKVECCSVETITQNIWSSISLDQLTHQHCYIKWKLKTNSDCVWVDFVIVVWMHTRRRFKCVRCVIWIVRVI